MVAVAVVAMMPTAAVGHALARSAGAGPTAATIAADATPTTDAAPVLLWDISSFDIAARGSDANVWTSTAERPSTCCRSGWDVRDWQALPPINTPTRPALVWRQNSDVPIFAIDGSGAVWWRNLFYGADPCLSPSCTDSSKWTPVPATFRSAPTALSMESIRTRNEGGQDPGTLDLFGVGADQTLQHLHYDGQHWGASEILGGILTSAPTAVTWGPQRIDIVARGADGAVWSRYFSNGIWYPWYSLGGQIIGSPTVTAGAVGRLDVYATGLDHALWSRYFTDAGFGDWYSLGGVLISDPGAAAVNPDNQLIAAVGTDGYLWSLEYYRAFQGWQQHRPMP